MGGACDGVVGRSNRTVTWRSSSPGRAVRAHGFKRCYWEGGGAHGWSETRRALQRGERESSSKSTRSVGWCRLGAGGANLSNRTAADACAPPRCCALLQPRRYPPRHIGVPSRRFGVPSRATAAPVGGSFYQKSGARPSRRRLLAPARSRGWKRWSGIGLPTTSTPPRAIARTKPISPSARARFAGRHRLSAS